MNTKSILVIGLVVLLFTNIFIFGIKQDEIKKLESRLFAEASKTDPEAIYRHQREVFLHALEWCESNGLPYAVNPSDSDRTPSFGAFQFKPGTFRGYSEKYGIAGALMDYDAQYAILSKMLDDPTVKWAEKEFPGCMRKIGLPPVKY